MKNEIHKILGPVFRVKNKILEIFKLMFHVKHFPPGMNVKQEKLFFGLGMGASFLYSLTFIWRYLEAYAWLYTYYPAKKTYILREGALMEEFPVLMGNALIGFLFVIIGMIGFGIMHYVYFQQGSKSIYLMKRLPDKMELYKRMLTFPLLVFLICAVTAFLLLVFYYGIYIIATPEQCLQPNQWPLW